MWRVLVISTVVGTTLYLGGDYLGYLDKPCEKPITYRLGIWDPRFDLSEKSLLFALTQAEGVWENAWGRELFAYSPTKGQLPINLIYDYRQEVTEELSVIERTVKTGERSYDTLEERYQSLKAQYAELKRGYDSAVTAFNIKSTAYEGSIERWNKGKRSSREEFERLEAERLALEAEFSSVKILEARLNTLVKEINAMVEELNALARELNLNVEDYNTIGASRGETFAGGTYTLEQDGERIDIFEFENEAKLVRVLAHELGHALGLEHVNDPKAIMYYLNESDNSQLSNADIAALKMLCGVE